MMPSTCFEPEGSSSGRRLYVRVWYNVVCMHQYISLVGRRVCSIEHTALKIKILI